MAVLLLVGIGTTASEAGVMIECTIAGVNVTVAELPLPDAPADDTEVLRATQNAIAPIEPSENSSQVPFALAGRYLADPDMVRRICACSRLVVPNPIPQELLKVPIQSSLRLK